MITLNETERRFCADVCGLREQRRQRQISRPLRWWPAMFEEMDRRGIRYRRGDTCWIQMFPPTALRPWTEAEQREIESIIRAFGGDVTYRMCADGRPDWVANPGQGVRAV